MELAENKDIVIEALNSGAEKGSNYCSGLSRKSPAKYGAYLQMINTYQIELENFTGPLDLLLFFIRRDELDIMDIPISHITDEYLEFVEAAKFLNVAVAGEFIAMAALLMRIKAKFLLPKPVLRKR